MTCYYFVCGSDESETRKKIEEEIKQWLVSPELVKIVESFGGKYPDVDDTKHLVNWLLGFSEKWDYRQKQKTITNDKNSEVLRWTVNNSQISEEQQKAVFDGINMLGLKNVSIPHFDFYDYILVLGGARMACLYRTKYAKELILKMKRNPRAVVMLSGMRPVSDTERNMTDSYAPDALTEFDLMNAGAEQAFELSGEYEEIKYMNPNMKKSWAIRTYLDLEYGFQIQSVCGPSSNPELRRANSADTFNFFAERQQIKSGSRVLMVTSQIYVPYQQMEAISNLAIPNNIYVETVGFPTEWNVNQQGMMRTENYLQEIRSTIQAINRYLQG